MQREFYLHACVSNVYLPGALKGQEKSLNSPKVEFQIAVNPHVSTRK